MNSRDGDQGTGQSGIRTVHRGFTSRNGGKGNWLTIEDEDDQSSSKKVYDDVIMNIRMKVSSLERDVLKAIACSRRVILVPFRVDGMMLRTRQLVNAF